MTRTYIYVADRDADPDYVDGEDDEADEEEVGGTARGATQRRRPKRQRAADSRSGLEWQCVTIANEDDDVNRQPVRALQLLPVEERRWCDSHSASHTGHRECSQVQR